MQDIQSILFHENSRQELLPGFDPAFPYIATQAELDRYQIPWHWHPAVELFYIESGTLEYTTPKGTWRFPPGSGGFVNANILHCSRVIPSGEPAIQKLHIFDPQLLSGSRESRMETLYILPLIASSQEIIPLFPENPAHFPILENIRQGFSLQSQDFGYEFRLRDTLCAIWLQLLGLPLCFDQAAHTTDRQIKELMIYIHQHYAEKLSVQRLADHIHISKRSCFRLFRENLHMSPTDYLRDYRLRQACGLLANTDSSITEIGYACGLGSASYFGKCFSRALGCTPAQYRKMARS